MCLIYILFFKIYVFLSKDIYIYMYHGGENDYLPEFFVELFSGDGLVITAQMNPGN